MKHYAGLDVSMEETAICVVDDGGVVVAEMRVASEPQAIAVAFAPWRETLVKIGHEAGGLSPWLHAGLQASGLPAICIETRRMKALSKDEDYAMSPFIRQGFMPRF